MKNSQTERVLLVSAHWVGAGLVLRKTDGAWRVIEAAPILWKWAMGLTAPELKAQLIQRRLKWEWAPCSASLSTTLPPSS
ncbi:hypothetical protein IB275_30385 [Pseudomonas sp. PDM21]|uniref:hypothetical protein n=1 Tax=Pseudomonas sp. PDM21 TaxID=2769257 RepID=UPI0017832ABF|nr:hypothetical protein [Pseudomonas sp. PDM21]MBD9674924.1 hypothetical protein [Pseudomonas sp. PDM21]